MAKITTKELVTADIEALRVMSHGELFAWSRANDLSAMVVSRG